jgi:hypothetical protein
VRGRPVGDEHPDGRDIGPYRGATREWSAEAMDASQQSQAGTRIFSRVLGPFLVIADVTAIARTPDMQLLLAQFEANSQWTWVAGGLVLIFGLIVVATHQCWRGVAAIVVSSLS